MPPHGLLKKGSQQMKGNLFVFAVIGLGILSGCGKINSEDIETKAIYMDASIKEVNSNTAECYSRLTVDTDVGTSVELSGKDSLECNGYKMFRENSVVSDYIYYKAQVPRKASGQYKIHLRKSDKDYFAATEMPEPVELKNIASGFLAYRDQPLTVSWKVNGDPTDQIYATLSTETIGDHDDFKFCQIYSKAQLGDGFLVVPALQNNCHVMTSKPLTIELSVVRAKYGVPATGFKNKIRGERVVNVWGTLN
jgi:hypothetical protein